RKPPPPPPRPATALTTIAITQPATARTHAGRPAACQPAFSQRAGRTRLSVRRQQRAAPGREGAPGRRVPGDHLSGAGRLARCSGGSHPELHDPPRNPGRVYPLHLPAPRVPERDRLSVAPRPPPRR